jgi:hypothetical protein
MLLQRHQLRIPELLGSSKPDRHIKFTRLSSHDANTDMLGDSARHRAGPQTSIHLTVADAEVYSPPGRDAVQEMHAHLAGPN